MQTPPPPPACDADSDHTFLRDLALGAAAAPTAPDMPPAIDVSFESFAQMSMDREWRDVYVAPAGGNLRAQLERVDAFYVARSEAFEAREAALAVQLPRHDVDDDYVRMPDPLRASEHELREYTRDLQRVRGARAARAAAKAAVNACVADLERLRGFCTLNLMVALWRDDGDDEPLLELFAFASAPVALRARQHALRDLYARAFHATASKKGRARKRRWSVLDCRHIGWLVVAYLGAVLAMVVLIVALLLASGNPSTLPDWRPTYLVFRGAALALLMAWYAVVNMHVWTRKRMNYRFVFDTTHRPRTTPYALARMLAPLTAAAMLLFAVYLFVARANAMAATRWFAFAAFVGLVAVLVLPVRVLCWRARRWLLLHLGRLVVAPFPHVRFADFYVGDQLVSMVVLMYDVSFGLCYCLYDVWVPESAQVCFASQTIVRLCLVGLPSMFRFMQCARRWRDSRWQDTSSAIDMGKYASKIVVVIIAGVGRGLNMLNVDNGAIPPMLVALIVTCVVAYVYTCYWDLWRDWGIMHWHSRNWLLRDVLLYRRKWVYYAAIPTNLVLRIAWIAPGAFFGLYVQSDVFYIFVGVLEETRRFIWNFFRFEHELIANSGHYRPTLDVPPPDDCEDADNRDTRLHPLDVPPSWLSLSELGALGVPKLKLFMRATFQRAPPPPLQACPDVAPASVP